MNIKTIKNDIQEATKKIAPQWSLENFIAVNPYLGYDGLHFHETAKLFAERSNIKMTLPLSYYLNQYENGTITKQDIEQALVENGQFITVDEFLIQSAQESETKEKLKNLVTLTDFFEGKTKLNLSDIMINSISNWSSSYFDKSLSIWKKKRETNSLFTDWKLEAEIDLTPEILGLKNFRKVVKTIPNNEDEALEFIVNKLKLNLLDTEAYFHTLLLKTIGWSSFIAGQDWHDNLYHSKSNLLSSFLITLLTYEYAIYEIFGNEKELFEWHKKTKKISELNKSSNNNKLNLELIFQDAFDHQNERKLVSKINKKQRKSKSPKKSKAQAVFCIDVRSEIIRRNIEHHDSEIETIGFAGFFGFPIKYSSSSSLNENHQCPALIPSQFEVKDEVEENLLAKAKSKKQLFITWKKFRSGAVSTFSYVSSFGLFYLFKLLRNSFKNQIRNSEKSNNIKHNLSLDLSDISLEDKIALAKNSLTAMGIKDSLSPFVFIIGHSSKSTNNPHASGLECGACGGHSGEINAKTAAQILNEPLVRDGLKNNGIEIPNNTIFVAGLHNTINDEITLFYNKNESSKINTEIEQIQKTFSKASIATRTERLTRFNGDISTHEKELLNREKDWSQTRPEWGLAGCNSFIVGAREHTMGINLNGESFLHNYNWKTDADFKILETIMTAPMVVTSWINLQYYASVTDNIHFGAGNKTLHNVAAGIGVIEGASGDLRIGLPLQSVHDGNNFQHSPNRLNVVIQAPDVVINSILQKHSNIKNLFDNAWLSLFSMNDEGFITHKYLSDLNWIGIESSINPEIKKENKLLQNK